MLSKEIVAFAEGNTAYFEAFQDYYFNKESMTQENHDKLSNAFFAEVEKRSNITRSAENATSWAANPMVQWTAMSVVDATINTVLPMVLNKNIGVFTNLKTVGFGDIVKYTVKPRTLFTVSRGAKGERTTFRQKAYAGDLVISPEEHLVTVYTDLYRVLAGKEDLVEFVRLVVLAIENAMGKDAAAALTTGLSAANYPAALKKTGAFVQKTMIELAELVQAYNYGVKPIIVGTASALANVLPDSSLGYRGIWDASAGSVRLMKDFFGFELVELSQFAAGATPADGLALADNVLYVISPALEKLVQGNYRPAC